ncbi:MAG: hypothetical protein ACTHMM_21180 [Agriterribacter sp.]
MSLSKLINQTIKNIISLKSSKITLKTEKLKDGATIEYIGEAIEIGLPVDIKNEDGTNAVLPDGEYETESGTKFKVLEGVVSEVENAAPAEEIQQEQEVKAEGAETVAEEVVTQVAPEILTAIQDAITKAIEPIAAELNKVKSSTTEFNSNLTKLSKIVDIIADQPAGEAGQAVGFSKKPAADKHEAPKGAVAAFSSALSQK